MKVGDSPVLPAGVAEGHPVTSEQQALLWAIIDRPDEDTPRLVYADWLDEHGPTGADRARAAFIRLQIEAARLEEYDPRRLDLEGQAEALLNVQREDGVPRAWLAGLEGWMVNHHYGSFERGFPALVTVKPDELLDRGHELWAVTPIRRLNTWEGWRPGTEPRDAEFVRCPHLARLRSLNLQGVPSSVAGLPALFASPHLEGLDYLGVYRASEQPWLLSLFGSPLRDTLTGLGLASYDLGADVRALSDSGLLGRLRRLHFQCSGAAWTAEASQALAAGPTGRLEELGLHSVNLSGPALRALAAAPPLPALERLTISSRFTADTVAALAEWLASDRLPRLRALEIPYSPALGAAGVAALADCPGLARLRDLDLTGDRLGNRGARALAASPHLANLRVLRLEQNGIPGTAARALAEAPHLKGLRVLDLAWNPVPAAAQKAIHLLLGPGVLR
jgi:uncharacterized protein (TIGR02996 family)